MTVLDDAWLGEPSRAHPDARFRVRSAFPGEPGVALLDVDAGERLPTAVDALSDQPAVAALSVLGRDGDRAVCQVTASLPVFDSLREAGVPVAFPVTVRNGTMRLSLRGDAARFAALADRLDDAGLAYTVEAVEPLDALDTRLTPQQRRALRLAVDRGFYAVPREYELRELADELGVAPSTASETLRRATGTALERYLEGRDA
ncbi:helix-turn-helix domain-containing protein [Natronomonas sp. EA1]|uniref:helix-turn-helix domain-containing protein n=1 Tax=Natronomonas sp. EA1 TaxID=3421655 RepID=UPI003EBB9D80